MDQRRLFTPPCEAISLQLHFVEGEGWTARVASRLQGEPWRDQPWVQYSSLSAGELLDVVLAEIEGRA